ncbi:hypothetical protein DLAC_05377 [Tieghemostelium lacteum]|uniref:NB-ARC domain-containing protein n=1 Tax=Tieghemostelium lacteum TaxID=361077 RepID=A0A151ZFT9_TIELA|nr:hypothetical protein DLAC_05377 [Tieghemostelium lacteum]|eukprot:KYQ92795.1 hypothetical protein DLAC_05377 [Tieghemostelium lacteum]
MKLYSQPSKTFISRENEIKSIRDTLEKENVVLVNGDEGVGKSQLVSAYCKEYDSDYDFIFYIRDVIYTNDYITVFLAQLFDHVVPLPITEYLDLLDNSPEMKWLIVFDDLGNLSRTMIDNFPLKINHKVSGNCHAIFIDHTVNPLIQLQNDPVPTLTVKPLPDNQVLVLLKSLGLSECKESDLKLIVSLCHGNVRLVEVFSNYLVSTGMVNPETNLTAFLSNLPKNLSAKETLKLILKQILVYFKRNVNFPSELFNCLIYFDEFNIKYEWLEFIRTNNILETAYTVNHMNTFVSLLLEYKISKNDFSTMSIKIDKGILRVFRELDEGSLKNQNIALHAMIMIEEHLDNVSKNDVSRHLFKLLNNHANLFDLDAELVTSGYLAMSDVFTEIHSNDKGSISLCKEALELVGKREDPFYNQKARLYLRIGMSYTIDTNQDLDKALENIEEANRLFKLSPQELNDFHEVNLFLGLIELYKGNYQDAIPFLTTSIEQSDQNGVNETKMKAQYNIGICLQQLNGKENLDKSIEYFNESLIESMAQFGPSDEQTQQCLKAIAISYGALNNNQKSKDFTNQYLKSLQTEEKLSKAEIREETELIAEEISKLIN